MLHRSPLVPALTAAIASFLVSAVAHGQQTVPPDPVDVAPPLDLTVPTDIFDATEFLYTAADPIQTGVAPGTIERRRVAVLRGRVLDRDGLALAGVEVSVLDHPEYGTTNSRLDGHFDLVVNGGGELTVVYEAPGYLPVHRRVTAPWRDWAHLDDVVLMALDPRVTSVVSGSPVIQVAMGSESEDEDGVRRAVLLVPGGTTAEMVMPDGSREPLPTLSIRATEYTVGPLGPLAMPAPLPPNTGYTYALEYSADEALEAGAASVVFSRSLVHYSENFLDFPVGTSVPAGAYDRQLGAWVAGENGRVVEILDVVADVAVLAVGTDGEPATDADLAALGITEEELVTLATLYEPGTTLWRVPIPHFTPWDCNWPYGPPPEAVPPPEEEEPTEKPGPDDLPPDDRNTNDDPSDDDHDDGEPSEDEPEPDCTAGSVIECENQILRKTVSVPGVPYTLHYGSDRVRGRGASSWILKPVLSGGEIASSLKRIELVIEVAGRRFTETFAPEPNLTYTFHWDGRDAYGRLVQASQPVTMRIGYVYDAVYYEPSSFRRSFSRYPSGSVSRFEGRRTGGEIVLWRQYHTTGDLVTKALGGWEARHERLGGWSFGVHHRFQPVDGVLLEGDGGRWKPSYLGGWIVERFAGTGAYGDGGDGGPARSAELAYPMGLAAAPDGSVYVADTFNQRVRRIAPDGTITTVAGDGTVCQPGFESDPDTRCGDGGPATAAQLYDPHDVAVAADGSLLIADTGNGCIRRVRTDGIIHRVAGVCAEDGGAIAVHSASVPTVDTKAVGSPEECDDCDAVWSLLDDPVAVTAAPNGGFYLVDRGDQTVRYVGADGDIATVAGSGSFGFFGDGGPAREAGLADPSDAALGPNGALYIADCSNSRIRRVRLDGTIETIAGTGEWGAAGDGGPATAARLGCPVALDFAADGTLYVVDWGTLHVRRIEPDGVIATLAGTGTDYTGSFQWEGFPALQASLDDPAGIAVVAGGVTLVTDAAKNHVHRLALRRFPQLGEGEVAVAGRSGSAVHVFSSEGRHLRTVNSTTGITELTFEYDGSGLLVSITDRDGLVTTLERAADGTPLAIVGPYGQRSELSVDTDGNLVAVTDPAGLTTAFEYGAQPELGLLTASIDRQGQRSDYEYDLFGRVLSATDAAGATKELRRYGRDNGRYLSVRLELPEGGSRYFTKRRWYGGTVRYLGWRVGRSDVSEYLVRRQVRSEDGTETWRLPDGTVHRSRLEPHPVWSMAAPQVAERRVTTPSGLSRVSSTDLEVELADPTDPLSVTRGTETVTVNGRLFTRTYEAATGEVTTVSAEGREGRYTLDGIGRVVESAFGTFAPVSFTYDAFGRVSSISQSDGTETRTVELSYDSLGRLDSLTDPATRTTLFGHDDANRITAQTRPDGETLGFDWEPDGDLAALTPPARSAHGFAYTPVDLVERYAPPELSGVATDTTYVHDLARRLTGITRPDGSSVTIDRDLGGRPTSIVIPEGSYSLTYGLDSGQLLSIDAPAGESISYSWDGFLLTGTTWSGSVAGTVTRTYDTDFRVSSRLVDGTSEVTFSYDGDGLVTRAGELSISRDAATGVVAGTSLGVVTTSRSVSAFGELASAEAAVSGTPLYAVSYGRDTLGRIVTETETVDGVTTTWEYGYDLAGRLVTVTKDGTAFATYTYDANGNRLSYDGPFGSATATYDEQDRLVTYGDTSYEYTLAGELVSKTENGQTVTYDYDPLGNLRSVTLPDGITIDYVIDGQNRRVGKKVDGTLTKGFLYKDQLNPIAEIDGSGAVVARFVYGTKPHVPDSMEKGGVTYRIVSDHLGSVRLVVNTSDGSITQRLDYDAFGRVTLDTNPGFQPFGYAGGLYDPQTGLVRFGARDYDPEVGRWTSKDPILFEGGQTNLYVYAHNDPANIVDLDGLQPKSPLGGWKTPLVALCDGVRNAGKIQERRKPEDGLFPDEAGDECGEPPPLEQFAEQIERFCDKFDLYSEDQLSERKEDHGRVLWWDRFKEKAALP